MADETKQDQEELSLRKLLLAIDVPGKMLSKLGAGNRLHLVTAAGTFTGDVEGFDDDDEKLSVLGHIEKGLIDGMEAHGDKVKRDMLRLRNVQHRTSLDGPVTSFHALWINPDTVIAITYGEMSVTEGDDE